jgi:DNA-binding response OmpR family regulator
MYNFQEFKNLSILYAEDDDVLRDITEKTLQLIAGKVYSAADGVSALAIYHTHHVDIVILDIHMGAVGGIAVAEEIRKKNASIPIVIVSGSIETDDLLSACKLNLVEYIRKPIEFKTMIDVLFTSLNRLKENGLLLAKISNSVVYDYLAKVFIKDGAILSLTKNEINAIELLLSRRGQIIGYETFSHILDEEMSNGALKNLILRLRKKIGNDGSIRNLSKVGYTLI